MHVDPTGVRARHPSPVYRSRPARLLLAALLTGGLAAGCVGPPGATPGSAPTRGAGYEQALRTLDQDRAAGKVALARFLDANPRDPRAEGAAIELARLHAADGELDAAAQRLEWLLRNVPYGARSGEARGILAEVQERSGDLEGAYRTLAATRWSELTPEARTATRGRLAELAATRGDHLAQLRWLADDRLEQTGDGAREADARLDAAIALLDPETVRPLARQLGRRVPAARLWMRAAELAIESGDTAGAEEALRLAGALPLSSAEGERLALLTTRLRGGALTRGAVSRLPRLGDAPQLERFDPRELSAPIGVLLPLSGTFSEFGWRSFEGISLAAGIFDARAQHPAGGVELLVRDTGGDPDRAVAAFEELAEEGVVAVIGPLLGREAGATARVADALGVPLLALSRREEVASLGDRVFRFGLTPRAETEILADYATGDLGLTRFAMLYPRDRYGSRVRGLFWEALEARGAEVVGLASYDPASTDFADAVRSLIGYRLIDSGTRKLLAEREKLLDQAKRSTPERAAELRLEAEELTGPDGTPLPPFVDFEALFIPDTHETVALVAPQLAFHGVKGVRLLGLSDWNHPDLVAIGRNHVNGALFTAPYFHESALPHVADFTSRYEETFRAPPDAFSAQAYDAARLLFSAIASGARDRGELSGALRRGGAVAGVSGVTAVLPDGNAAKRPHLLGVHRGRIMSVDEAGEPPYLQPASRDESEDSPRSP